MSTLTTEKRQRRTKAGMGELLEGVLSILGEYEEPITVRHLFYRCANGGLIDKTENAYNSLRSHLVKWRRSRIIPYSSFVDGTRWHYGATTFDSLGEYVQHAASAYRLNLWSQSEFYPEVWVEKDAIAGMVYSVAQEWNLKVFVSRGDTSMSALAGAADTFNYHARNGKTPVILYLGDYDESGLAIPKTIQGNLEKDHDCSVQLIRVGVNEDQIAYYKLPTRPAKGSRRGESVNEAVDIDAMPPAVIRQLLSDSIEELIDGGQLLRLKEIEIMEQETLRNLSIHLK